MKKLIAILFPLILGLVCLGCSSDSEPKINPQILGYGILQQKEDVCYVTIDSVRYAVFSLLMVGSIPGEPIRTDHFEKYLGKEVTCFTAKAWKEPQFVLGKMDAAQIELMYYKEPISGRSILSLIVFCIIILFFLPPNSSKDTVKNGS